MRRSSARRIWRWPPTPGVFLLGEDIGDPPGGVFKTTAGLQTKWGKERVRPTPIAEQAIIGAATGAALVGMRPVAEIMFADFMGVCIDQITNHAAKQRYMSGGATHVPMTMRVLTSGRSRRLWRAAYPVAGGMAAACAGAEGGLPVHDAGCARAVDHLHLRRRSVRPSGIDGDDFRRAEAGSAGRRLSHPRWAWPRYGARERTSPSSPSVGRCTSAWRLPRNWRRRASTPR